MEARFSPPKPLSWTYSQEIDGAAVFCADFLKGNG